MQSGKIGNSYSFKTYVEKLIFAGENKRNPMMYHRRVDVVFTRRQNMFFKSTAKHIYLMIQSFKKTFRHARISFVFKFEDIGFVRSRLFDINEDIQFPYVYPSENTIYDMELHPGKYRTMDLKKIKKDIYGDDEDKIESSQITTTDGFFIYMAIYIAPYTIVDIAVGCSNNNNNNCMYESIRKSVGYYNQIKLINTPKKFRRYFNMNDDELFKITNENLYKIEKIYNMPIIIENWDDMNNFKHYIDPSNSNHSIDLKIINNDHIKLHIKEDRFYNNNGNKGITLTNGKIRNGIICHKYNQNLKKIETTCDGVNIIYYDVETFNKMKIKDDYFYHEQTKKLKESVIYEFNNITTIKNDLNKININLLKYKSFNKMLLQLFLINNEHVKNPDKIDDIENRFLSSSYHGGISYCISDNIEMNILKLDMNGCYQYYLCDDKFYIPHRKYDIYKYMSNEELYSLKFIPVGLYYCEIKTSDNEHINKIFRFSTNNCYYYYDIKSAMMLGLKIIMLNVKSGNGENIKNCILYSKSNQRISGYALFNNFIKDIYKHKYNSDDTKNETIKTIVSRIHGTLSETLKIKKNIKYFTENEYKNIINVDCDDIVEIPKNKKFERKTNDYMNKLIIKENQYVFRWGRIGTCISSYVRFKLCELYLSINKKYNTFLNDIVNLKVDSFTVKNPEYWKPKLLEFIKLDNELGNWKIEMDGTCKFAFGYMLDK
jgi:hypothetical protein